MSRFDYVKSDSFADARRDEFKQLFVSIENGITAIGGSLPDPARGIFVGREKALALTKLEEAYMWIGKALKEDQIARSGQDTLIAPL